MSVQTDTPPRFVLPGTWGRINLASEASTANSIRHVLAEITHRRDDLANLRAELRTRFQKAADTAREGGASDFYVALSLTPKVPLPAWVAVFTPSIDSTDFSALGLDELRRFLEIGTANWGAEGAQRNAIEVADGDERMHAVRHSWRRVHELEEGGSVKQFDFVEADYWLAAHNPNRIALLTFSTALAEYETEMLALFDAIVGTTRWPSRTTKIES